MNASVSQQRPPQLGGCEVSQSVVYEADPAGESGRRDDGGSEDPQAVPPLAHWTGWEVRYSA